MSEHGPQNPGRRRDRAPLIVGLAIKAAFTLAFVLALVVHFVLLGTDRFNWLEAPKRSDRVSSAQVSPAQVSPAQVSAAQVAHPSSRLPAG